MFEFSVYSSISIVHRGVQNMWDVIVFPLAYLYLYLRSLIIFMATGLAVWNSTTSCGSNQICVNRSPCRGIHLSVCTSVTDTLHRSMLRLGKLSTSTVSAKTPHAYHPRALMALQILPPHEFGHNPPPPPPPPTVCLSVWENSLRFTWSWAKRTIFHQSVPICPPSNSTQTHRQTSTHTSFSLSPLLSVNESLVGSILKSSLQTPLQPRWLQRSSTYISMTGATCSW